MVTSLVRISTTAGTTIYNRDTSVLVSAGRAPDETLLYTKKPAGLLKPNDETPWDKQYLDISLEQITDALSTEPNYSRAERAIFGVDSEGKLVRDGRTRLIPVLRTYLIEGLWQKDKSADKPGTLGQLTREDLESKIKRESGNDFSSREYNEMANQVYDYVLAWHEVEGNPLVQLATVRNWLSGETVGPRERDIYRALGEINPAFNEFLDTRPGIESRWDSYKLWVKVRQGLRHRFELMKAKGGYQNGDSEANDTLVEGGKHVSMTPFERHVLDRIFNQISLQHLNVLVTAVEPVTIDDSVDSKADRESKPLLYKGLCKEKPDEIKGSVIPYDSARNLVHVIEEAFQFAIHGYLKAGHVTEAVKEIYGFKDDSDINRHRVFSHTISKVLCYLDSEQAEVFIRQLSSDRPEVIQQVIRAVNFMRGEIFSGRMEEYLRLQPGVLKSALGVAASLTAALLPMEYFEAMAAQGAAFRLRDQISQNGNLSRKQRSSMEDEARKAAGRVDELSLLLATKYGIEAGDDKRFLSSDFLFLPSTFLRQVWRGGPFLDIFQDRERIEAIASGFAWKNRDRYVTYVGAKGLLGLAGLEPLIRLIPLTDFIDQLRSVSKL